jgi:uncharacterized protein DUF6812
MDHRHEAVVVETPRYRIEGNLTLPREGYRSRLSDYVNQRDREFFAIQDASITAFDTPDEPVQMPFVMVARRHIVLVAPASGQA